VTLHYLEVHGWLGSLNNNWKAGKYYQVGFDGGSYGHKVLGSAVAIPNPTDKEIIQQGLNGLFEQNKLPDPTTIVPCIDDATAHKIVVFAGDVLEKAAKGSITDLVSLINLIKGFGDQIPQSVKDCLDGNKELEALGLKYHIDNNTDTAALEKKVIAYVTLHYLEVHGWFGSLNTNWKAGKYYQVGFDGAGYGHKVLGVSIPNPTDKEILQQALNGLFEENKLPDPTTIVPCIDDATAHKLVLFIGEVLEKAAKGSITDLVSLVNLIKGFGDQIPQSVKDCLDGNAEFKALGLKYHIDDTTDTSALEKKIIAYVTLHYLEVHGWFGSLNNNWKAGKAYQVGFDGASYGHKVLGITPTDVAKLRSEQ
jgi:CRISPR/Cas system-associated endonuclease Cas3-HD